MLLGLACAALAPGCSPTATPAGATPSPLQEHEDELARQEAAIEDAGPDSNVPATPDPQRTVDEAALLVTLIGEPSRVSFSLASLFGGLAYGATGVVVTGATILYVARAKFIAPIVAPFLVGIGSMGLGIYHLATGADLAALQLELLRALQHNATPAQIVSTFEPKLKGTAERARFKRIAYSYGLFGLTALTLAGAIAATIRPVDQLQGGALPSVLYGIAAVNLVGGITMRTYESPAETAWEAYVRSSTLP